MNDMLTLEPMRPGTIEDTPPAPPGWYALWTRSHCEPLVRDQLVAKGFEAFLPEVDRWSRRRGARHLVRVPLFPGYLFLRCAMDKAGYIAIRQARGLVAVLGDRWDRLPTIPDAEVGAVQRIVAAGAPALPYPYLRVGQRVRITRGPLADLEGLLVRTKPARGLLVIAVELLKRSVAVQVDCTATAPV